MGLDGFQIVVDPASPSGIDLRNEPDFHKIERMLDLASRNARLQAGSDEPPSTADVNWADVLDAAADLAKTGRDLRVLVVVVRALTNMDGLAGLAAGLTLIVENLAEYWDTIHPVLRERDDPKQAALRRINSLKQLENDDNGLLGDLEMNPILTLPGIGIITGQNLCDASLSEFEAMNEAPSGLGKAEQDRLRSAHVANQNRVTAACRAVAAEKPELAASLKQGVADARAAVLMLQSVFSEKAGLSNGTGISFPELTQFLDRAHAMMESGMVEVDAAQQAGQSASGATAPARDAAAPQPDTAPSVKGEINSRDDVERALGQIIAFYERTEPSSPIPHLARRVQRMVHMDFLELMSEIAPSGMKEFRSAAGVQDTK